MDRINHIKIRTPHPEIVDAFLRRVCEIPEGWALGAASTPLPPDAPLGPGGVLDHAELTRDAEADGVARGGFITGDPSSRQFKIFGSPTPRVWAICIASRHIERAHERCVERGIPATPILVA